MLHRTWTLRSNAGRLIRLVSIPCMFIYRNCVDLMPSLFLYPLRDFLPQTSLEDSSWISLIVLCSSLVSLSVTPFTLNRVVFCSRRGRERDRGRTREGEEEERVEGDRKRVPRRVPGTAPVDEPGEGMEGEGKEERGTHHYSYTKAEKNTTSQQVQEHTHISVSLSPSLYQ